MTPAVVLDEIVDDDGPAPISKVDLRRSGGSRDRINARVLIVGVSVVSLCMNTWGLAHNGLGNQYYTAATRSMAGSWHNWFYAAFDSGGFISVDKPPLPLWVTAIVVRIFGVSTWSVILPSALAGVAAVAMLWIVVRRHFGVVAATISALVLALSPINVAVNRLNLPEPWMLLLLISAVWGLQRSFTSDRPLRWLVLSGAFIGLAFNTKMLAAYIVLPAFAAAVLLGVTTWRRRIGHGAMLAASVAVFSFPWILIVDAIPAASRPYVGGSRNNTVMDLVVGYNGLGRVEGNGVGGGGFGGRAGGGPGGITGPGGVMGGSPGRYRLLSPAIGGQMGWLIPLAIFAAGVAIWFNRRSRVRRAGVAMWIGWTLLYSYIFSIAGGTFHSYYTSAIVPGLAAVIGIGVASMVPLVRADTRWLLVAAAALIATADLQLTLSDRQPAFYGWTRPVLVIASAVAVAVGVAAVVQHRQRQLLVAGGIALAALLVAPAAWAVSETNNAVLNATLPQAGPRTGVAGGSFGSKSSNGDQALAQWLLDHHTDETWDLVVANAQDGSGLTADQGVTVMAIGGFMGTDNSLTVARFAGFVAGGQVRYVQTGGFGFGGGGGGGRSGGFGGGNTAANSVIAAARAACTPVTAASDPTLPSAYSGQIYDCAGRAAALRTA